MRSVNSNLLADAEFNLVASRSAQAAVIKGHQSRQSQRGSQHPNYS